ncbi:ABC transporter substrate-binding protein [Saccharopolyspora mangrovi]|uniref:ABC transporter substrate-binding protein n=1 Tax=Saccharopolyspora mangrovi TaxID=3082379 RepID=A0ABU6AHT3_9PSEU|nr:ABC transporter substrate-binding protein [Saccharopolyspora sp. S2-29]MEB3370934.1 ABC transporter substrate-binding protein [Saccharopolyspora sp. S2-29]
MVLAALLLVTGCFAAPQQDAGNGRLNVVMMQPPRSALSPFSDDAFKLSRLGIAETLVNLDADGNPLPGLAASWRQAGPVEWEFSLRPGVRFHDGTSLNAAVAVNALQRAAQAQPKPRILDGVELTVTEAGPDRVVVRTATPDPMLPQRLSSPQLSVLATAAYQPDGTVNPAGAGTGPFVLTELRGSQGASLERFNEHWNGPARAPGLDVSFVPDGAARAAALRTGTGDIVEAIPASQAGLLEPGTFTEVPMPRTNTLYLNSRPGGVFGDPGLRAAVREAIDVAPIVSGPYENRADIAQGLLGPAIPWSAQRPPRSGATPPAAARGERITLATFSDRAELPEVAAILEQQLERAGFQVELVVREYSQIETDALDGRFDAFILSRATVLDSGDPAAYLRSDFACDGGFNLSGLCDPAVDAALREAEGEGDMRTRRAKILEAEREILRTDAAIPMLHERVVQGNAPGVQGAAFDPRERMLVQRDTRKGAE